jgi:uncharacterized protein (DUF433 family)
MEKVIIKNPGILGGEPVFRGTRVPFKILTDYLEGGDSLDQFLEQYPSITREAAVAALEEARLSLAAQLHENTARRVRSQTAICWFAFAW